MAGTKVWRISYFSSDIFPIVYFSFVIHDIHFSPTCWLVEICHWKLSSCLGRCEHRGQRSAWLQAVIKTHSVKLTKGFKADIVIYCQSSPVAGDTYHGVITGFLMSFKILQAFILLDFDNWVCISGSSPLNLQLTQGRIWHLNFTIYF